MSQGARRSTHSAGKRQIRGGHTLRVVQVPLFFVSFSPLESGPNLRPSSHHGKREAMTPALRLTLTPSRERRSCAGLTEPGDPLRRGP